MIIWTKGDKVLLFIFLLIYNFLDILFYFRNTRRRKKSHLKSYFSVIKLSTRVVAWWLFYLIFIGFHFKVLLKLVISQYSSFCFVRESITEWF